MKKRILALVAAMALAVALCSCAGDPLPGTVDGTGSAGSDLSVSVTDGGNDLSSDPTDLFSQSSPASGTVSDEADSATDSGTESDVLEDEDFPENDDSDWNNGGNDTPPDGGNEDDPDDYIPDYETPPTDDAEESSSSTNKNTASSDKNSASTQTDGAGTSSGPDPVVGNTLSGLMAITDQKNGSIAVVDLSKGDITSSSAKVWEWSANMHRDVTYCASGTHLDDVVIREVHGGLFNGTVVGITSSDGMIAVVEYPSGKCLFSANGAGTGPHDIEILPNGLVVVACSGNSDSSQSWLRVYRAASKNDNTCAQVRLLGAHGVLWDPAENLLWALGKSELNAYTVGGSPSSTPTVTQVSGKGIAGFSGGHCLSPVYENPDRLWISDGKGVYQYSKSLNMLYYNYSGASRISVSDVKSVNSFANGTTVWSVADSSNATAAHNTDTVQIWYYNVTASGKKNAAYKEVRFSNRDFYKVRVFDAAYQ